MFWSNMDESNFGYLN